VDRRGIVVAVVTDSRREKTDGTGDTFPAELKVSEAPFSQDLQVGLCVHQRGPNYPYRHPGQPTWFCAERGGPLSRL
jgi:hypothetical protein